MKLVIDRKTWLRGEDAAESYLLRPKDKKMCCLGFYSLACGLTPDQIEGKSAPRGISREIQPDEFAWMFKDRTYRDYTRDAGLAMNINDTPVGERLDYGVHAQVIESEEQREKMLTELFARNGVEVEFVD